MQCPRRQGVYQLLVMMTLAVAVLFFMAEGMVWLDPGAGIAVMSCDGVIRLRRTLVDDMQ